MTVEDELRRIGEALADPAPDDVKERVRLATTTLPAQRRPGLARRVWRPVAGVLVAAGALTSTVVAVVSRDQPTLTAPPTGPATTHPAGQASSPTVRAAIGGLGIRCSGTGASVSAERIMVGPGGAVPVLEVNAAQLAATIRLIGATGTTTSSDPTAPSASVTAAWDVSPGRYIVSCLVAGVAVGQTATVTLVAASSDPCRGTNGVAWEIYPAADAAVIANAAVPSRIRTLLPKLRASDTIAPPAALGEAGRAMTWRVFRNGEPIAAFQLFRRDTRDRWILDSASACGFLQLRQP